MKPPLRCYCGKNIPRVAMDTTNFPAYSQILQLQHPDYLLEEDVLIKGFL